MGTDIHRIDRPIDMEKALMKAAFKAMLESTTDMVFLKSPDLVYQAASMPFVKMVGKEAVSEIIGRTDMEIFEDQELAKRYVADDHKLLESGELIEAVNINPLKAEALTLPTGAFCTRSISFP